MPNASTPPTPMNSRTGFTLLSLTAVVLVGLNLRAGITSASALFHDLQLFLGYGPLIAALLPSIPTLVFAMAGAGTAWIARRIGLAGTIMLALGVLSVGLGFRAIPTTWALLAGTVAAMCGIALCNVAMPSFIRQHFAEKTSTMTGVYTVTMSVGATAASSLSVPLALAAGSPTLGLATWAFLALAGALAFIPFLMMARAENAATKGPEAKAAKGINPLALLRTGRGMVITGLFSVQSLMAYAIMSWLPSVLISRSMSPSDAGVILGVVQLVSIPATMLSLWMVNKKNMLRGAIMMCSICVGLGLAGLLILPLSLAWLCAVAMGIGFSIFPLVLLIISQSGDTAEETTAMSTLAQSVGYLVATSGPFGMGLLYAASGSWTLPILLLIGVACIQLCLGIAASSYKKSTPHRVR